MCLITSGFANIFWQIFTGIKRWRKSWKVKKWKTRGNIKHAGNNMWPWHVYNRCCLSGWASVAAFSQVMAAISWKPWHFENGCSLWKLVQTKSTSISCSPVAASVSSPDTPAFSPFTKPTLTQVKPLTFTDTSTFHFPLPATRPLLLFQSLTLLHYYCHMLSRSVQYST